MHTTPFHPAMLPAALPWGDEYDLPLSPPAQVAMGQLKIGARGGQLQALLGSCVGIAFIWKKQGRCALAHCLLPEAGEAEAGQLGARYVSMAVPSLLRLIGASQADYADIEVVVAGGATMINGLSRMQIGQQNAEAARRHLRKHGLTISYCRTGGESGRTLHIDCATGRYSVQEIAATKQQAPRAAHV